MSQAHADVAILGGGPGGYEAALVAAQLGAQVTVVEADGLGGACVLTDCVPSKTLIATSETMGILPVRRISASGSRATKAGCGPAGGTGGRRQDRPGRGPANAVHRPPDAGRDRSPSTRHG